MYSRGQRRPEPAPRPWWRRWGPAVLQTVAGAVVLGLVIRLFGSEAVLDGRRALTPWAIGAGLLLGAVGTVAHAQRWRLAASASGRAWPFAAVVAAYYRAGFLNGLLPGGVAGDALRTVEQHRTPLTAPAPTGPAGTRPATSDAPGTEESHPSINRPAATIRAGAGDGRSRLKAWLSSAGVVFGERWCGTTVTLVAAAVALTGINGWWAAALALAAAAHLAAAVAALRPIRAGVVASMLALSVVGYSAFVAMFVVAAQVIAPEIALGHVLVLAAVAVAGHSIPVNVGGWGPREAITAAGFAAVGLPASLGVTVASGYGALALVSTLPGGLAVAAEIARGRWFGRSERR